MRPRGFYRDLSMLAHVLDYWSSGFSIKPASDLQQKVLKAQQQQLEALKPDLISESESVLIESRPMVESHVTKEPLTLASWQKMQAQLVTLMFVEVKGRLFWSWNETSAFRRSGRSVTRVCVCVLLDTAVCRTHSTLSRSDGFTSVKELSSQTMWHKH